MFFWTACVYYEEDSYHFLSYIPILFFVEKEAMSTKSIGCTIKTYKQNHQKKSQDSLLIYFYHRVNDDWIVKRKH